MNRVLAFVFFIVGVAILVWWYVSGAEMWTTTARLVSVRDDLFGTVTQHWERHFTPGIEWFGPAALVCLLAGWVLLKRSRQSSAA